MSYQVDRPPHPLFHDSCTPSALIKDTFPVSLPMPTSAGDTILGPYYDHRPLLDTSAPSPHLPVTAGWMLSPVPEHAASSLATAGSIGVSSHGPSPPPAAAAAAAVAAAAAAATHRTPLPTPPLSSVESQHHHHPSAHIPFSSWSSAAAANSDTMSAPALPPPPPMSYWGYPAQQQHHHHHHHLHAPSPIKDHSSTITTLTRKPTLPKPSCKPAANTAASSPSTPPRRYKCAVCVKRFSRPSSLATHMHSHTGEKPFKCQVEGCGRRFSVVSNLRRHAKIHSGKPCLQAATATC